MYSVFFVALLVLLFYLVQVKELVCLTVRCHFLKLRIVLLFLYNFILFSFFPQQMLRS